MRLLQITEGNMLTHCAFTNLINLFEGTPFATLLQSCVGLCTSVSDNIVGTKYFVRCQFIVIYFIRNLICCDADIDECTTNNGGCHAHATCTNTQGSRVCTCHLGYIGDGINCKRKSNSFNSLNRAAIA